MSHITIPVKLNTYEGMVYATVTPPDGNGSEWVCERDRTATKARKKLQTLLFDTMLAGIRARECFQMAILVPKEPDVIFVVRWHLYGWQYDILREDSRNGSCSMMSSEPPTYEGFYNTMRVAIRHIEQCFGGLSWTSWPLPQE